jgi:ABC-type nitrate/sulfonate/bicarbonate transport system permease component
MFDLSPGTPVGFVVMELRRRFARARAADDVGASAIEWVIITGFLIAIALGVGALIISKVNKAANDITIPHQP